jgi:2-polyprenyl-3-methyl-5-hydroxy-6-metoxy-1,4-benzoquinol methylase
MTRKTSHTENREPVLEYVLSWIRFQTAQKYIAKNSTVADLGCGYNATFLKRLSQNILKGVGYDVSVAKRGLPKNITLKEINLNKSVGGPSSFDNVTALAILEHVKNPARFINQIKSILRKSGKFIITTPHKRSKPILEFLSSQGLISKDEITDHKNYFDEALLGKTLKNSGYKIIKLETFSLGLNIICVAKKI